MGSTYYNIPLTSQQIDNIQCSLVSKAEDTDNYTVLSECVYLVDYLDKELYHANYKLNNEYEETKFKEMSLGEFVKFVKEKKLIDVKHFVDVLYAFRKYVSESNIEIMEDYSKLENEIDKAYEDLKNE